MIYYIVKLYVMYCLNVPLYNGRMYVIKRRIHLVSFLVNILPLQYEQNQYCSADYPCTASGSRRIEHDKRAAE